MVRLTPSTAIVRCPAREKAFSIPAMVIRVAVIGRNVAVQACRREQRMQAPHPNPGFVQAAQSLDRLRSLRKIAVQAPFSDQRSQAERPEREVVRAMRMIGRLRTFRLRTPTSTAVGELAPPILRKVRRADTRHTKVQAALERIVGASACAGLLLVRVRGDVATLAASNAGDRFRLERALTPGGAVHEWLAEVGVARVRWTRL